mmetsp:Transcript_11399/g.28336  ORF Transcript_11399/g.28336 Transcript_11399/m.28336 type:complete len:546 (+) Transcript_11399:138-1775(+)
MLGSRLCLVLLAFVLVMREGFAQHAIPTSAGNWAEFKTAVSDKTEEDQRKMWCQCSTDGISNGAETAVGFDARTGTAPYRFIGCGAHTNYYTKDCITPGWAIIERNAARQGSAPDGDSCCEDYDDPPGGRGEASDNIDFVTCARGGQFGGYPFRLCYPEGSCKGTTGHLSLDRRASYKLCGGHMGCSADRQAKWDGGELISTLILTGAKGDPSLDGTSWEGERGTLDDAIADWTDCCKSCSGTAGCVAWDFAPLASSCSLFSTRGSRVRDLFSYAGEPGFDDASLDCQNRHGDIHTCIHAPKCGQEEILATAAAFDPKVCPTNNPVRCLIADTTGQSRLQCTSLDRALDESDPACGLCREDDIRSGLHPRTQGTIAGSVLGGLSFLATSFYVWFRMRFARDYVQVESDQVVGKGKRTETWTTIHKGKTTTHTATHYTVEVEWTWEGKKMTKTITRKGKNYTNKLLLTLSKEDGELSEFFWKYVDNVSDSGQVVYGTGFASEEGGPLKPTVKPTVSSLSADSALPALGPDGPNSPSILSHSPSYYR